MVDFIVTQTPSNCSTDSGAVANCFTSTPAELQ
jgi:hypothetical protein